MKLNDLDKKNTALSALKENFNYNFNPSKLGFVDAKRMLHKVNSLIRETKTSTAAHTSHANSAYLKLMFIKQALSEHMSTLKPTKIIFENEEVEKSQVILAAQDMVDSIQKMIEEVNDMLVKELPALVDSIQSEIGVTESSQFDELANKSLTTLNKTLSQSRKDMVSALNALTGQGNPEVFGSGGSEKAVTDLSSDDEDTEDMDLDMDQGTEEPEDMSSEPSDETFAPEEPEEFEEPEEMPVPGAGRTKRR